MRFRHFDYLRNFLLVARHLNMGKAARELNLSAVSHQVRQLEAELGFELFTRGGRTLALTRQGRELLQSAGQAFTGLEGEILRLRRRDSGQITIGMATYFASRWLSPRLMTFITRHADVGLRIQPLLDLSDLSDNDLDLAVRWGRGGWQDRNMRVELIFPCAAMLTSNAEIGRIIESEGIESVLSQQTLLHDHDDSRAWNDWFSAAGIAWSPGPHKLVIPDPNVRVQAVMDGQGIALYDSLVADEVQAGRLYQYESVRLSDYGYYLIYPQDIESIPAVMTFRDWIMQEARDYNLPLK